MSKLRKMKWFDWAICAVLLTLAAGPIFGQTARTTGPESGSGSAAAGGGTQYTEGATDATITGTAVLWEDTSDTLRPVSAAKPLPVNVISGAGFDCSGAAIYSTNTNGNTELVAISGSTTIYVCGFSLATSSSTAVSVRLVKGTGTACATNEASVTPTYVLQAPASVGPTGIVVPPSGHTGLKTAAGDALCIETNAAQTVQAIVWYAQF